MRHATWKSETGIVIEFLPDEEGPFIFGKIEGNNMAASAQVVRPPMADGAITFNISNDPRMSVFTGYVQGIGNHSKYAEAALDEAVNTMCTAFNPKRFGTLVYHTYAGNYAIRCRAIALPTVERIQETTIARFSVDLQADTPYWHEAEDKIIPLGLQRPVARFPLFLRFGTGSPLGLIYNALNASNPTPEPIAPIIEVFSAVELVHVQNTTTGKSLQINRPVAEGQKMRIDISDFRAELYELNGTGEYEFLQDVTNWLTIDSDWWRLEPGENVIVVNEDIAQSSPVTLVRYNIPILGVLP